MRTILSIPIGLSVSALGDFRKTGNIVIDKTTDLLWQYNPVGENK